MRKCILFLSIILITANMNAQEKLGNLLCENSTNPIGLDISQPRFSWVLNSDERSVLQTAYEIKVSLDKSPSVSKNLVWQSGKQMSDQSVHVTYGGKALQPTKRYYWQVRIWDNEGNTSAWSEPAFFEMGMMNPAQWQAKWITAGYQEDSVLRPSPFFRRNFSSSKKISSARAYITSLGIYEAFINGKRVGDMYLTPGWTSYNKRLQYQVFDITDLIQQGSNTIGVALGSGWYRGFLAWGNNKNIYGKELALLVQLQLNYSDGSSSMILSDESWKSSTGAVRYSEIYHGETIDASKEQAGWNTHSFDDSKWSPVKIKEHSKESIIATYNEPIKKHEAFKAVKVITTPAGEKVIDFGQNLVGLVEVKLSGNAGDTVKIFHAEVLDNKGNFYIDNLRAAAQKNMYVLDGKGEKTFSPHFTFQGFRYIKVEGIKGEWRPENFTAYALYSAMKPTGSFSSSHALLNQLQHNIQWGQKGNFLDVPTDCPQRDERLGWTGDAQVFAKTAAYNMQVNNFFSKWLKDVAADQQPNGSVPFVVPNVLGPGAGASAGWADVATIIPWDMYRIYGDKRILEDQFSSMKLWVKYMQDNSTNNLWNKGFHFGDWLFYRPFDDNDGRSAVTDKYLIAQCFFAHSTQLVINAATVLGKSDDVSYYTDLLQKVKTAFQKEYMTSTGRLVSGTQTAYVLALNFDMLPNEIRMQTADRLSENIKSYGNHLTTGFLGTPYLCHVLTRFGYDSVAFKLLMQETYPSWLYPVKMGATTIWERWDGIKPDGTFQTPGMNSFNHYAYGAIGDWMYKVVAGIDMFEDVPGYKRIRIKPHVGGGLTEVNGKLDTYYGAIGSHWKLKDGQFSLDVEIPANTTATIFIPSASGESVKENGNALKDVKGIKVVGNEKGYTMVEVGSGKYSFTSKP